MVYIGMDHGTTGISFAILEENGDVREVFKISREDSKKGLVSAIEEIEKQIREINIQIVMLQTKKIKLEGELLKVKYGG